ncbi:aspartate/methionine/tyrosine aminotransferase [Stella humosa]|uniref:Aminotransferase n=1 Tax=Stella humosa TaxID=94 RepID=A0A3N1MEX8_9PROT|nr:aminotransferase class I/II-fold pyridoxal phosphate-dependent enzyme [Stella humosa]ROP99735.1 aspartate/methionine/tyrosine aminotransferase [Stella humosa]BBK31038.1 aminotransferase [Stella humosa]
MALKVAGRGRIPPFIVMDVVRAAEERAAAGHDVLHMEIGQPSTPAPRGVLAAAQAALAGNVLGYTGAFGLEALRQRLAEWYRLRYGVVVPVERIALTPGSSGAFVLAFLAAFEPGDRVALATPCYPAYRNILTALGIEAVLVPADLEHGFQPTPDLLERAGPLDGVIVASPANPTGTMLAAADLAALAGWCRAKGVRLVSDEIYHGITFGVDGVTALAFDQDAVVINSFSKYFSMTGWRLGWMIVPADMVRAVECLAQNLFISPPTLSQHAAIAAFDCVPELEENVARYARNRALLLDELPKAGFDRLAPADGAFYIYADVAHLTNDSTLFCRRMLEEVGIAATPGVDFDPERGNRTLRFSFAGATETMAEAARRLVAWKR